MFSFKKIAPLTLIILALFVVGCSGTTPAAGNGSDPINSISVSGVGEASGSPDVAYVQLGIDIADENIGDAVAQANEVMASITETMAGFDIEEADLQTINFNVWADEIYDPQAGIPTGERTFRVNATLRVTVRDITTTGDVIEAGLAAGANQIHGLNFGIDDTTSLESEARTAAVADARARAEELATALGMKVGDPIFVSEGGGFSPVFTDSRFGFDEAGFGGGGGGGPAISEGELTVSIAVNVVFELVK